MGIEDFCRRPWVLIPGTLCNGDVFADFLEAGGIPNGNRRYVLPHFPKVEDYYEGLSEATRGGAIVFGFSLGVLIAARLADRLEASEYLFMGLHPHTDEPFKRDLRYSLQRDVEALGGGSALASRLPPFAGSTPDRVRATILAMANAEADHIGPQTELALNRPSALEPLRNTPVPMTLMTGTEDKQTPLELARDAAKVSPRGTFVPLKGLGHYALLEDPESCWQAFVTSRSQGA